VQLLDLAAEDAHFASQRAKASIGEEGDGLPLELAGQARDEQRQ
jgi:hypothetical protein